MFRILSHDPDGLGYNGKVRLKCLSWYNSGCRARHLLACMIDISRETNPSDEHILSSFHVNNAIYVSQNICVYFYNLFNL